MYKRLIIFLIRRKLGVKKWQGFRFKNQKSEDIYCFDGLRLIKVTPDPTVKVWGAREKESTVSLNWLLNDKCEIEFTNC